MKKIVMIGAGGFGREVLSIIRDSKRYTVDCFIDRDKTLHGKMIDGVPVIGDDSKLKTINRDRGLRACFVAAGDRYLRKSLYDLAKDNGLECVTIIHSSAYVPENVHIGEGSVIYPNSSVYPGVTIGKGCLVNSNVTIGHDSEIGNFVNINPGANLAGKIKVGDLSFLGIGCAIMENIEIGGGAIIGGQSFVNRHVAARKTCFGVPAIPKDKRGK